MLILMMIGLGVGISSAVTPILLSEIASDENRGTITTLNQLFITLSIFVAAMISYGFVKYVNHGWQYVLALGGCVPSLIFILFQVMIPESPKWLVTQNRLEEARLILLRLRSISICTQTQINDMVEQEIQSMLLELDEGKNSVKSTNQSSIGKSNDSNNPILLNSNDDYSLNNTNSSSSIDNKQVEWRDVLIYKKSLIIGCGLMFFQSMTGINTVIFYSTTIFGYAGFDNSILATALVCFINFSSTFICTYIIDYFGRKQLLRWGVYVMLVSLIVLSSVLIQGSSGPTSGLIAVITVLVYIIGFAFGLGAVCWVVMSEIMPTNLRAKAMSLFLSINW